MLSPGACGACCAALTCDYDIKVVQPVSVALAACAACQQEIHDHAGVVPQAVGGQEQASAALPELGQQLQQPGILQASAFVLSAAETAVTLRHGTCDAQDVHAQTRCMQVWMGCGVDVICGIMPVSRGYIREM